MTRSQIHRGTKFSRQAVSALFGLGGLWKLILLSALGFGSAVFQTAAAEDADFAIGTKLADMLRAGRSVVSANQGLINDPDISDKQFTSDKFVGKADAIYLKRVGTALNVNELSERDRRLLDAQRRAMRQVVDDHQAEINRPGVSFKGFIPAIFARLTNEEFGVIAGKEARIRVTAPPDLVRNRKARPDSWEKNILETRFLTTGWPEGKAFTEEVEFEGRLAFRMLLPEYYRESCLACHGTPKGELDITSYPKEGGVAGDLAGAISIVIFR